MKTKAIVFVVSLFLLISLSALADVPDEITYQGRLLYNGNPVTSATSVVFRLYQTSSGGSAVWTETHGSVTPDSNGIYTEVLGETVAVPDDYDALWLELVVAGNTLTPRKKLTSAPFVLRAGELPNLYIGGQVGIGTTSPTFDVDLWKSSAGDVTQRIRNDNVNGIAQLNLFVNGNGSGDPRIQFDVSGEVAYSLGVDNDDSNKFKFSAGAGLGGSDALTIQSNGNVGIGTTSPGAKLEVNGDIIVNGAIRVPDLKYGQTEGGGQSSTTSASFVDYGGISSLNFTTTSTKVFRFDGHLDAYHTIDNGYFEAALFVNDTEISRFGTRSGTSARQSKILHLHSLVELGPGSYILKLKWRNGQGSGTVWSFNHPSTARISYHEIIGVSP